MILFVAVVVGGIFWFQAREVKAPTQQVIAPAIKTQPVQDETASWYTFTNLKDEYEFKHPNTWILKNYENLNIVELSSPKSSFSDVNFRFYASLDDLTAKYQTSAKSLDDFILGNSSNNFFDMKKIDFAGVTAWVGVEPSMAGSYVYYIEKNGHVYNIEFAQIGSATELTSIHKGILSSFKFIR